MPGAMSSVTSWIVRDPAGVPIAQRYSNGQEYYYLLDGQGDVVAMEDPGTIQGAGDLCPTGNEAGLFGAPTAVWLANPLGLLQQVRDDDTKLHLGPGGFRAESSGVLTQGPGIQFADEQQGNLDEVANNPPNGGLGVLDGVLVDISPSGLDIIQQHLTSLGAYGASAPENVEMVRRLEEDATSGAHSGAAGFASGADAAFYVHELSEAALEGVGVSHDSAHGLSFSLYGLNPRAVYAPQVVAAHPEIFNDSWFDFWGLPRPDRGGNY